jgi:peptidoglycan-associated lipoprotein
MGARILSLLAVMVLVAGCSHQPKDAGSITTEGGMTSNVTASPAPVQAAGPTPGTQQDLVVNVGDRVFFGYDKYDLSPEARTTIEKQAAWLKTYPHINVSVEGHCDERGTREYNLALGEKRATAVRNYLVALGIEPARLQTISYGKERPAVTGSDETAWAQNRRGVLVVQ